MSSDITDTTTTTIGSVTERQEDEPEAETNDTSTTELILAFGIFLIMLGVGASCNRDLFGKMISSRKALKAALVGLACQFGLMPVLSYLLTLMFQVDNKYTALGFILTGCMPGGGTSNVISMWVGGVLELSVFMTVISTTAAFVLTPFWLFVLSTAIGIESELGFFEIFITFLFLMVPLSLGALLNYCTPVVKQVADRLLSISALILFLSVIVLLAVDNPDSLERARDYQIWVPAVLYFPLAAAIAWILTTFLIPLEAALKRTIVVEIGIQNLTLGLAIGLASLDKQSQRDQALPFPLLYAMLMYMWAFVMVPAGQYQRYYNKQHGIADNDSDFFVEETDDEADDSTTNEPQSPRDDDNQNNNGDDEESPTAALREKDKQEGTIPTAGEEETEREGLET